MIKTATERKLRVLIAGALALTLSQLALAEDGRAADKREPAVVKVSIPDQRTGIAEPKVDTDIEAHIKALNERIVRDLEENLEKIGFSRIELVVAEVPTRG